MTSTIIDKDDYYICNNKVIYYADKFDPEKHLKIKPLSIEDFKLQQKYNLYSIFITNTVSDNKNKYDPTPYIFIPPDQIRDYYNYTEKYTPISKEYNKYVFYINKYNNIYQIFKNIYYNINKFIIIHFKDIFKDKQIINEHYFNNALCVNVLKSDIVNIMLNPKCLDSDLSKQDIFKIINNNIVKYKFTKETDFKGLYNIPISLILNVSKFWMLKPRLNYNSMIPKNLNDNFVTFYGFKPFIQQIIIDKRSMLPNQKIHFIHKDALILSKLYNNFTYNYKKLDKKDDLMELSYNNIHNDKFIKDHSAYDILFNNFESDDDYYKSHYKLPIYIEIDFDNNIIKYDYNNLANKKEIIHLDNFINSNKVDLKPIKKIISTTNNKNTDKSNINNDDTNINIINPIIPSYYKNIFIDEEEEIDDEEVIDEVEEIDKDVIDDDVIDDVIDDDDVIDEKEEIDEEEKIDE